jgi:hypothetical protein
VADHEARMFLTATTSDAISANNVGGQLTITNEGPEEEPVDKVNPEDDIHVGTSYLGTGEQVTYAEGGYVSVPLGNSVEFKMKDLNENYVLGTELNDPAMQLSVLPNALSGGVDVANSGTVPVETRVLNENPLVPNDDVAKTDLEPGQSISSWLDVEGYTNVSAQNIGTAPAMEIAVIDPLTAEFGGAISLDDNGEAMRFLASEGSVTICPNLSSLIDKIYFVISKVCPSEADFPLCQIKLLETYLTDAYPQCVKVAAEVVLTEIRVTIENQSSDCLDWDVIDPGDQEGLEDDEKTGEIEIEPTGEVETLPKWSNQLTRVDTEPVNVIFRPMVGDTYVGEVYLQTNDGIISRATDNPNSVEVEYASGSNTVNVLAGATYAGNATLNTADQTIELILAGPDSTQVANSGTVDVVVEDASGQPVTLAPGESVELYAGAVGNILAKVTSNVVINGEGATSQTALSGATVIAYDKADSCVAANTPDADAVYDAGCPQAGSCVTDASGECHIVVPANSEYFVLTTEPNHIDMLPSHSIGMVEVDQTKKARLAFLQDIVGKKTPGKSTKKTGSELWIFEPSYVVWDDTTEYYPFVFESDSNWEVDVCVEAPEGYEPADGVNCLQSFVAGEVKSLLFTIIEVGSVPGPVKTKMKFKGPNGKTQTHDSKVGMRMTKELAQQKGVKVDNKGRLIAGASGKMHTQSVNPAPQPVLTPTNEEDVGFWSRLVNALKRFFLGD